MQSSVEAIVFDMDGVLLDTQTPVNKLFKEFLHELGSDWRDEDSQAIMGTPPQFWSRYAIEKFGLKMTMDQFQQEVYARERHLYEVHLPIMPGASELVALASQHYRTALATSSPPLLVDPLVNHPDFIGRFEVVITGEEVQNGKPAPDIYLEACRRLNVSPARSVCIEDSANGIRAGLNAGMKVIALPEPSGQLDPELLARAHLVVHSLKELTRSRIENLMN